MSKAIPMLYFGLSRILFIEDQLSHYENERRAIFCILNLSYLIYDSVSESFHFINTTDLVRVALDFDKTAVNQSISCRTDDPNASTTLFFNFQELPVGGRISLDKQVYTIYTFFTSPLIPKRLEQTTFTKQLLCKFLKRAISMNYSDQNSRSCSY